MSGRKRLLAATAVGALAAALLPASPAFASNVDVRSTEIACPTGIVATDPFTDVPNTEDYADDVSCLNAYGIALGTTATTYNPTGNISRAQMARFLYRLALDATAPGTAGAANRSKLNTNGNTAATSFTDLDLVGDQEGKDAINAIANAGITKGDDPTPTEAKPYNPTGTVSRGQMASFIARVQNEFLGRGVTASAGDKFDDDNGTTHEANINIIATEGITQGIADRSFGPSGLLSRAQMARFLARKLDILVEKGFVINVYFAGKGVNVTPDAEENRPSTSTQTASRTYTATGLVPGAEYRITLVRESTATPSTTAPGGYRFATETATNSATGFLAVTGLTASNTGVRILTVNGSAPQTNTGTGDALTPSNGLTAVAVASSNGTITFVITNTTNSTDSVFPVVYLNGGDVNAPNSDTQVGARPLAQGGINPRLEVTQDGVSAEPVDAGGVTNFVATP